MKWSKTFIPTLKEDPQEAEVASHKLMLRAGLIRRLSSGTYTYLPMGYKALSKAKKIIREEMISAGASEILMPALQPPELWKKTGRYDEMGEVMMKCGTRRGKEVVLGPTHEEVVTSLVANEVRSYKDLPLILYQIQTKFRDEVRPRFGVIRSSEFIMKDAYSFDSSAPAMEKSYKAMYEAYCRIFERVGLDFIPVQADPGLMGGGLSHEFMVPSEIGEDKIVVCSCGYAASTEVAAVSAKGEITSSDKKPEKMKSVSTPQKSSAREVSDALQVSISEIVKTLIYETDSSFIAVLVRGDHEVNESKVKRHLNTKIFKLADENKVKEITGAQSGFSGPCGLSVKILADNSVQEMVNMVVGANEKDKHLVNVNLKRDFKVDVWLDARVISEGDACPKCGGNIEFKHAIELGHTFKLGTKYSSVLNATFLDKEGKDRPVIMGCYGIGVNRILAALVENRHDAGGIKWPMSVNPAEVVIIPVKKEDKTLCSEAERVYDELIKAGIDAILDDREKSAGIKFKDADLIGFPIQIIIGNKSLDQGKIEVTERATGTKKLVDKKKITKYVQSLISGE